MMMCDNDESDCEYDSSQCNWLGWAKLTIMTMSENEGDNDENDIYDSDCEYEYDSSQWWPAAFQYPAMAYAAAP